MTTGSPAYARNSGVLGSPHFTEENTYGSTVVTVAGTVLAAVGSLTLLIALRHGGPPLNSCLCWVLVPGGVRSPIGAALRLMELSSHSWPGFRSVRPRATGSPVVT